MDNVYIGGANQEEHDENRSQFMEVAKRMNITFNEGKSIKSTDTISILGYQISKGVIRPDPERVKPLIDLPPPTDIAQSKRILGMFAYYSQWIPNFSDHIHLLVQNKVFPPPPHLKFAMHLIIYRRCWRRQPSSLLRVAFHLWLKLTRLILL